jgi:hypothetical protein
MLIYCPKHPLYSARRRPLVKRLCWCLPLFWLRSVLLRIGWSLAIGRPVVHRVPKETGCAFPQGPIFP